MSGGADLDRRLEHYSAEEASLSLVDEVARAIARVDGSDMQEICAYERDPNGPDCESDTCVGMSWDDHDAPAGREVYRRYAQVAIEAIEQVTDLRLEAVYRPVA